MPVGSTRHKNKIIGDVRYAADIEDDDILALLVIGLSRAIDR